METVHVAIDGKIKKRLEVMAKQMGLKLGVLARFVLYDYLAQKEKAQKEQA